jgi:cytochrome P450
MAAHVQTQAPSIPKPKRFVGHFPEYGKDPLAFMINAAKVGGVVAIQMGPFPAVLVTDPAAIEQVLVTNNKDFKKSLATRRVRVVTGDGILVSNGDIWRQHRRAVQPAFHSERIRAWADTMVSETKATTDTWRDGATLDIHKEMYELTLRIVVKTLLASDIERDEIETVGRSLAEGTEFFDSRFNGLSFFIPTFLPTPANIRVRRAVKRIDAIVFRLIAARRTHPGDGDVISMLLAARNDAGQLLSDKEIRDEVMTVFLAGHETTALALTWALFLLARNPAKQDALRQELSSVLKAGALPTLADIPRLSYTEAVVNETFRLYPPAYAVSRQVIQPTEIGGQQLGKGSLALVSIYATHRNPDRFPNPDAFEPERWLDGLAKRLPKGGFVPFAEGPRKCIGSSFAMQEAILALATICSRVGLAPTSNDEPKLVTAVTLRPADPVLLRVAKGSDQSP